VNDIEAVDEFPGTQSTLTLATISDDGMDYATPLFDKVGEERQLYWHSIPCGCSGQQPVSL